ncbi:hypothetical protein AVEN_107951-1 [Araneus ventricosus]|uniref:Uncharacterized protein n=1 Tax=Araneus ventricosus TaxID=182803 RepID=A0A4Y2JK55_ARAVE|nr:hypothetical protein AVEN_107951-1 [Araneus ventricosus]
MRNTEGRYKISRLNKRSIKNGTVHQRDTFPAEMLSATQGVKKRLFVVLGSDFRTSDSETNTTEVTLRSFTFPISFFLYPLSSLLNTLTSKGRGVVVVLPPGDSSSSWTNRPTAVVCLPSWC